MGKPKKNQMDIVDNSSVQGHTYQITTAFAYPADDILNVDLKNGETEANTAQPPPPYDPHDYGSPQNPTTFWETIFHLCMITAGPALLSIPKNFMALGYVYGSILVLVIFLYHWYAMRMIVNVEYALCKLKKQPHMSYSETMFYAFAEGPPRVRWFAAYSRRIIQTLYCVTWIGSLNIVLAGDNLKTCLQNVFDAEFSAREATLYTFVPLLLLTLLHRLKFLVPVSVLGNGILVVCIVAVVYDAVTDLDALTMPPPFGDLRQLPNCLSAILFVMNVTGLILPLKNEMRQPKRFNSNFGVLTVTYVPMTVLYLLFNFLCCMKYGSDLHVSVIENLPDGSALAQVMIFLFAASLILQQPLVTYVVFDTLWNNVLVGLRKSMDRPMFWEYTTRTLIFLISFAAAFAIPNINVFMMVSGTIGSAVDSMIFPALAETVVVRRGGCRGYKMMLYCIKNICIILMAVILTAVGLIACVDELAKTYRQ